MVAPSRVLFFAAVALFATALPPFVQPATAGCGCDHPPPAYAEVMPPFGSPGRTVRIFAKNGTSHKLGWIYEVSFGAKKVYVTATRTDSITAPVPSGLASGPVSIRVRSFGFDQTHGAEHFAALPTAPVVPSDDGTFGVLDMQAAVTADGTLLIPFDVGNVLDAKQFALELWNVGLAFGADDVVFYNTDGVDLTLFTLAVADQTQRYWGSYFGWTVQDDTGLVADVYDPKVVVARNSGLSHLLTYWRHEFRTYRDAHILGGSHMVNIDGFHPDGTLHIDHDRLVLAISGKLRTSAGALVLLSPGSLRVSLALKAATASGPIEPADMVRMLESNPTVRLLTTAGTPTTAPSTTSLPRGDDDHDDDHRGNDDDDRRGDDDHDDDHRGNDDNHRGNDDD